MINRDMKPYTLEQEVSTKIGGQLKKEYKPIKDISVALYKNRGYLVAGELVYTKTEYSGLTTFKELNSKKKYRLVSEDRKYSIEDFDTKPRLTVLDLKEVF